MINSAITQTTADTADTVFINNSSGRSVTFSGANDYKTQTIVQAGTLIVRNDTALGATTSGTTVDSGAILQLENNITIGAEAIANSGTVTNASGTGNLTVAGGELTLSNNNTYTGNTTISAGTLVVAGQTESATMDIAAGAELEFNVASGTRDNSTNTNFTGGGTLAKTGAGELFWNSALADFALDSGVLIDVREGTLRGANGGNDTWTNNLSDLNVEAGATFNGAGLQIRVDALTGAGTIQHGYTGASRLTFGVDNGTGVLPVSWKTLAPPVREIMLKSARARRHSRATKPSRARWRSKVARLSPLIAMSSARPPRAPV